MKLSVATPTHNTKWLRDCWESLKLQTHADFEWIVSVNGTAKVKDVHEIVGDDPRVRIFRDKSVTNGPSVGQRKKFAFSRAVGEAIIELDHDDILTPDALAEIAAAFESPDVGFVYSDAAAFEEGAPDQGRVIYRLDKDAWAANGFSFYEAEIGGVRPGRYECVRSFEPSAAALSLIFWAPDHVRAWRRDVYKELGGHDQAFQICDDHELMVRTYAITKMLHVQKPLYLYRVHGANTWLANVQNIESSTINIRNANVEKLVLRECEILGLPAFDLGAGINPREGWIAVDKHKHLQVDLEGRWPWETGSVGAFRAMDLLEHLPSKLHTMSEIHRCLRPGGWLLSMTPSADGRGAFMDPTHVSYWNEPSFWYWTRREQAAFIEDVAAGVRFQEMMLSTFAPSPWHEQNKIPYVQANLIALKDGYLGPGRRSF